MSNFTLPKSQRFRVIPGGKLPKYECYFCHQTSDTHESRCPSCGRFDCLVREEPEEHPKERTGQPAIQASKLKPKRLKVYSSGSEAWDRALGGGFVRPSSVLVSGPRGVGKSTRALAIALHLAHLTRGKALFGSAEMPADHVRHYCERAGLSRDLARLYIQDSSDALDLLTNIEQERPAVVVWDSVQRFTWEGELGETTLRQVVHHALEATKDYKLITLLISQVTKDEIFIGPNSLAHDVDVMVELSRDGESLAVSVPNKNRFAPTPRSGRESLGATDHREDPPITIDDDQPTADWFGRKPQGPPTTPGA